MGVRSEWQSSKRSFETSVLAVCCLKATLMSGLQLRSRVCSIMSPLADVSGVLVCGAVGSFCKTGSFTDGVTWMLSFF